MSRFFASPSELLMAAIDKSMAAIEFDMEGRILRANANFCNLMEYSEKELIGQHHRMFLDKAYAASPDYAAFWRKLRDGQFVSSEFQRFGKNEKRVFISANYNPISRAGRKPHKVVKFANDITASKLDEIEKSAKMDAVSRAQAVIEFTPSGDIIAANPNFLAALGYQPEEIVGRHHRIFVDPAYGRSPDYARFWERLRNGEFIADEFTRIGKNGQPVYIQASYNPIFGLSGEVVKVAKFATDVSERVRVVHRLGDALVKLANGDLVQRLDVPFIPSLETLRVSFNSSIERMCDTLRSVGINASEIQNGAEQIRIAADDLAQRTEQQAAALEETSAALAQITTAVNTSSKRADEAGDLVTRTKGEAEQSGQVVAKATAAMAEIAHSSDEISKIIGVIDEIAFQTNLLALNAGVEAARAGEAGRGFAVVAQEVRGLAQRSAEAAKEIKSLISTSGRQVGAGVDLVSRTGEALQAIVGEITGIHAHVIAIVASARQQAVGLQEINIALGTLNHGTQQNAAMVEESTAASNSLASEVHKLNQQLAQFQTDDGSVQSRAHARGGASRTARLQLLAS